MANRVLHERLQQHRRYLCARDSRRDFPLDAQPIAQARLLDPDVRFHEIQLLAQRNFLAALDGEQGAKQLAESADDLERLEVPLGDDERTDGVQRVEQEVRLQLQRQRTQLCRGEVGTNALGAQLL